MIVTRRRTLLAGAALTVLATVGRGHAADPVHISVTKGPNCSCCDSWAKASAGGRLFGFGGRINGIEPPQGATWHPGRFAHLSHRPGRPYVLEGHVPALAVRYLLHEKPERVTGLAVPGMPVGSPGMEVEGATPEEYSVIVFGPTGRKVWNRFRGTTEINC